MRKSLKIASIAAVALLALGIVVFAYASQQNALTANADDQQTTTQPALEWNNCTGPGHMMRMPPMRENGLQWINGLSENATLTTIQGTVVSEVRNILILNTDAGQVRVQMPREWIVGNETVSSIELFNGTFASAGQTVTMKVLENDVFSNSNFSINMMLGYEATNASGTSAYAVLPFNIQPAS